LGHHEKIFPTAPEIKFSYENLESCLQSNRDRIALTADMRRLSMDDSENYSLPSITLEVCTTQLFEHYNFPEDKKAPEYYEESITDREVHKQYSLNYRNCIYLSTLTPVNLTNELIFASGDGLFVYDREKGRLTGASSQEVRKLIQKRLAI